jgi:hypothetical protein
MRQAIAAASIIVDLDQDDGTLLVHAYQSSALMGL